MTFDDFVRNYWKCFIYHVSEFHPLDDDFLTTYGGELNWKLVCKNERRKWSLSFLKKYEPLENYLSWPNLALNAGIVWTEEWIAPFKDRLNPNYLRNNPSSPGYQGNGQRHEPTPITDEQLADLDTTLATWKYTSNQRKLYDQFIAPNLKDNSLENIFEKRFNYSQRYYFIIPREHDRQGLTPGFEIKGKNPFSDYDNQGIPLPIEGKLKVSNARYQEGKDRLYHLPRFTCFYHYKLVLVSDALKTFLQTLKLPPHHFYSVDFHANNITTNTAFYVLQLERDALTRDLDFEKIKLRYHVRKRDDPAPTFDQFKPVDKKLASYEELIAYKKELYKSDNVKEVEILPDRHLVKTDFDILTHGNSVIVSDPVKIKLEALFPGQFDFESAQHLLIEMDADRYNEKSRMNDGATVPLPPVAYSLDPKLAFYYDKMERLKDSPSVDIPANEKTEDEFAGVHQYLNLIVPDAFKKMYRSGPVGMDYEWLPVDGFYICNEYADKHPESFKSMVVAENGIGDHLGLILEKDSDYKLAPRLVEFMHESGEVVIL